MIKNMTAYIVKTLLLVKKYAADSVKRLLSIRIFVLCTRKMRIILCTIIFKSALNAASHFQKISQNIFRQAHWRKSKKRLQADGFRTISALSEPFIRLFKHTSLPFIAVR